MDGGLLCAIGFGVAILAFGAWVVCLQRAAAGMTSEQPSDTGRLLRESWWGRATFDGAHTWVRLLEYEHGWLAQNCPLNGGGQRWFPKSETVIGPLETAGFLEIGNLLPWKVRRMVCDCSHVFLFGRLARFVDER